MSEIVRAGTLAANSHNTQPWRFKISHSRITIGPDLTRRCPAVDPDDHHLFASLGCAVENMLQTADSFGRAAEPRLIEDGGRIEMALRPSRPSGSPLADAITQRQCTRTAYDGRPLTGDELASLAMAGSIERVDCHLVTDRARLESILELVVQGNTAQMRDPAFMAELVSWIRFNDAMAIAHLDGLAARSSAQPSLPAWLARRLLPYVMTERGENDKHARQIRSSAGIAVLAAASDDRAGWIAAGRACQRLALQATALGIRYAFINQAVEVPALRAQLASLVGLGGRRPDLVVRLGRGPVLPYSLRRPVDAVIDRS